MMLRLDKLVVTQGLAPTRTQAQKLIEAGLVEAFQAGRWIVASKSAAKYLPDTPLKAGQHADMKYVSRAGLKLEAILELGLVPVKNTVALDIGQSTGGFTDCLLHYGAKSVVGVEVGRGQLAPSLRSDPRVDCHEGINARYLEAQLSKKITEKFDLAVMDVSFISQTLILPNIPAFLKSGGYLISLVKPQFEVGPDNVGKNGIVKDLAAIKRLNKHIQAQINTLSFECIYYGESPIKGGDGNMEYLMVGKLK